MNRTSIVFVAAVCAAIVLLAGCGHKLSPEELQQLTKLKESLAATRAEVVQAKQETKEFGGLVGTLALLRLEVLKTNEALLDQRVNALESGAKMVITVPTTKDDPIRAAQIEADLVVAREKLKEAEEKAANAGGLIGAMAMMNVATQANTVAMLDQQRLMAKYGLLLPSVPADGKAKTP